MKMKSAEDYVQMIDCVAQISPLIKFSKPSGYLTLKRNHIFCNRDQNYWQHSKMGNGEKWCASLALSIVCELENAIWSKGSSAFISTVL